MHEATRAERCVVGVGGKEKIKEEAGILERGEKREGNEAEREQMIKMRIGLVISWEPVASEPV